MSGYSFSFCSDHICNSFEQAADDDTQAAQVLNLFSTGFIQLSVLYMYGYSFSFRSEHNCVSLNKLQTMRNDNKLLRF